MKALYISVSTKGTCYGDFSFWAAGSGAEAGKVDADGVAPEKAPRDATPKASFPVFLAWETAAVPADASVASTRLDMLPYVPYADADCPVASRASLGKIKVSIAKSYRAKHLALKSTVSYSRNTW